MKKRILSILLAALMVVSLLPATALADSDPDYFYIQATGGDVKVGMTKFEELTAPSLEYFTNGTNWMDFTPGSTEVLLASGTKVYFRNKDTADKISGAEAYWSFTMTTTSDGTAQVGGNIMTLLNGTGATTDLEDGTNNYAFADLFQNCKILTDASDLILPADTLAANCYKKMFSGCTDLKKAPELPATTLAKGCYDNMFNGCKALEAASALPATTLADDCYRNMFYGCSALEKAPELPAKNLVSSCYHSMFCNCTALNYIKVNFTDWKTDTHATDSWVSNVAATGTFVCPVELDTTYKNYSRIPTGWTVERDCFHITATGGAVNVGLSSSDDYADVSLDYSSDGVSWNNFSSEVAIPKDGTCYFRRHDDTATDSFMKTFTMTTSDGGTAQVGGNIMYLLDQTGAMNNFTDDTNNKAFAYLFRNCNILTDASELILPATTLATECYSYMFRGCTALKKAPELPATTLANYCYNSMFYYCTALKETPALPATTLAEGCYQSMFSDCEALETAPEKLPVVKLEKNCYKGMFFNCSKLETAPQLPATTLAPSCYEKMFYGCEALATAPALPVETLAQRCYYLMFYGCEALEAAPELPATTLAEGCYAYMFQNCSELDYIKVGFTAWDDANGATTSWVDGVAATGTFLCPDALETDGDHKDKASGVPVGWTVKKPNCFHITATGGTVTVGMEGDSTPSTTPSLEYSTNGTEWTDFTPGTTTVPVASGTKVYFRNKNIAVGINGDPNKYWRFTMTTSDGGTAQVGGNVMYLLDKTGAMTEFNTDDSSKYAFSSLFYRCEILTDASELILPATTLVDGCYYYMFALCKALTTAPELPATTLAEKCYNCMFYNCIKLEAAPELPAETLATSCYQNMFYNCKALETAPELPAEILAQQCYAYMFRGCEALETAPELPATTLAQNCYKYMFYGCSKLDYIKVGFAEWNDANGATTSWVDGVAATGTFFCPDALETDGDHKDSASGVPVGWTVKKPNCFHITATGGDVQVGLSRYQPVTLDYSSDGVTWTSLTANNAPVNIPSNATFYFRSNSATPADKFAYMYNNISFTMITTNSGTAQVGGNIMYLLDKTGTMKDFSSANDKAFARLFLNCPILTDASELILPAMKLAPYCYSNMFDGCTSLEAAPELPAMKLAPYCYSNMFDGCTSLEAAPELPATTLAEWCYSHMFDGCESLVNAPALPAADLAEYCYEWMFENCTHLVNAPNLSATDLKNYCYDGMFAGCTDLVTAPALPADTMVEGCYYQMFENCTSLETAPELPATTLANGCYNLMFNGCTHLVNAPDLPATELKDGCYDSMFQNCTSLTTAPDLMAKTLADSCYCNMFIGCTSLNSIKVGFSQWDTTNEMSWGNATYNWVGTTELDGSFGVADKGTFICPKDLTQTFDANHIPVNWTVETPRPSGGSSTPAVTVPVSGDGNTVKVSASVSGSTATVKDIKDADLAKVTGGEIIEIDLSGLKKNIDTAKIPTTTVGKIGEQAGMSVKLSTATVTFDQTATQEISDQAKGNTVELVVDDVKEVSLNAVQKEAVGKLDTALIIDAHLVSNGTRLCSESKGGFGGGKATVVLPYEIKNNRTAANYSVFYVDDAGKLQKLNAVYDKELAAFVFEIEHFSIYAVAYDENGMPFTDVAAGEYFYDAVKWAVASGITDGTDATHFSPFVPVTRAQVVTFLWRAAGSPEPTGTAAKFTDVRHGSYYEKAVAWAIEQGITKGTSKTTFTPGRDCKRGEIVTFLARFAGVKDTKTASKFTDVQPSRYYAAAVKWAVDNGVTKGTSKTTFSPNTLCKRAEAITFLYRWMVK